MKPKIAITFDDGPTEHTPRILDALEKHNAKATFFTLGKNISSDVDTVKRTVDLGSEVISHSWSHNRKPRLSQFPAEEIRKELTETHAEIERVIGFSPAMFRPPYGGVSDTLKDVAEEMGLSIILWSLDSWDWRSQNADEICNEVLSNVKANDVLLFHDEYASTADAIERVVPVLQEKYELVTVSELMQQDGFTPGARVIYPLGKTKYD